MRLTKFNGASLVDYIIPTAIVGIILGLGLTFFVQNGSLLNNILASLRGYTGGNNNKTIILNSQGSNSNIVSPGDLGGKHDKPVKSCNKVTNQCDIDYGDFILRAIPADLNQHVNEVGGSRGGEILASLLAQTIGYMEQTDPTNPDIGYLKQMKEAAYKMSNDMNEIENIARNSNTAADYVNDGVNSGAAKSLVYYTDEELKLNQQFKYMGARALGADLSNFPTGTKFIITSDILNDLNTAKIADPALVPLYNYANNIGVGSEFQTDDFLIEVGLPKINNDIVINPNTGKDPIERIDLSEENLDRLPASHKLARTQYYFDKEVNNLPGFIKNIVVDISTNMTSVKSNAANNAYIRPTMKDEDFQTQKDNLLHPTNTIDPNFINSLM